MKPISGLLSSAFTLCLMASVTQAATFTNFNARTNFDAVSTVTSTDDFEDLGIAPGGVVALSNPLTRGDFTYSTTAGNLVGLGSGIAGLTSVGLAPDLFANPLTIDLAGGFTAFGFDYSASGLGTLSVSVFDMASNLLDTFNVATSPMQSFFGITSDMAFGSILLEDGGIGGPVIDNLAAGSISVVPLPASSLLLLSGVFGLGAVARRRKASKTS